MFQQIDLKCIKVIFFDVDGVFTNGEITYSNNGVEFKTFDVKDGLGLVLLMEINVIPVIVTGRKSDIVKKRFKELGVKEIYQDVKNKHIFIKNYMFSNKLTASQTAFMGDDFQDLAVFDLVGFSIAPNDAVSKVKSSASYVTDAPGGRGAVRELSELLIKEKEHCPYETYIKLLKHKYGMANSQ